jgi:hypothetical protein
MPEHQYRTTVQDSGDPGYVNRLLIATPTTGNIRIEWHAARSGQVIPTNWSTVQMLQFMNGYYPLRYQVADAQNLIAKEVVEKEFEWVFLHEHDVILPPECFICLNDYMREKRVPVVSGLYYTRSRPSEPVLYRGRGTSYHADWTPGDKVWVDGVPTGCLLIHGSILRAMWAESEEYVLNNIKVRRVFDTPRASWTDPETGAHNTTAGTSDLDWCTRVMSGNFFAKAGWPEYQNMRWPFLVDTGKNMFCKHINPNGEQFP